VIHLECSYPCRLAGRFHGHCTGTETAIESICYWQKIIFIIALNFCLRTNGHPQLFENSIFANSENSQQLNLCQSGDHEIFPVGKHSIFIISLVESQFFCHQVFYIPGGKKATKNHDNHGVFLFSIKKL